MTSRSAQAITDEQLMWRYRQGDAAAFEQLYDRYQSKVYHFLLRQCGHVATAEELFQDVWMKLIRARERYEQTALFKTYLFTIARRRLIDYYRMMEPNRFERYDELSLESGGVEEVSGNIVNGNQLSFEQWLDDQSLQSHLAELIAALPMEQREAFLLRREGGFSVAQLAEVTDVPIEAAKSRLRYAIKKLHQGINAWLKTETKAN